MGVGVLGVFLLGFWAHAAVAPQPAAAQAPRVFEIRTYTSPDAAKLQALHARFRDHTMRVFERHGMTNVAYFAPQDAPLSQNTLIYVIAHASREQAARNWAAFRADPEWQKIAAASNANGNIVAKVESVFADAADFSPLK
jgi:hypothetical protein